MSILQKIQDTLKQYEIEHKVSSRTYFLLLEKVFYNGEDFIDMKVSIKRRKERESPDTKWIMEKIKN